MKNFDDEIAKFPEEDLKPVVVGDVADLAQDSSENELSFRLAEVESRELGKINKALEKINEGTYGVCEKCGDPISRARLKALPFASKCIRCQAEDEQNVWYS
ncbi:MAG: TraR/DksA family transcriptional regulator [Planctomycetaceae bacterium]|nr:TraR/DksA family transcriptional regulator [Planctomycetaceae bacterium]